MEDENNLTVGSIVFSENTKPNFVIESEQNSSCFSLNQIKLAVGISVVDEENNFYDFVPTEDITTFELANITTLFFSLLSAGSYGRIDPIKYIKEKNLQRHFKMQNFSK